jgi:uncharacterized protein (TIGR02271 family)
MNEQRTTVVGVFTDHTQARRAVEELRRVGFTESEIGVVSQDQGVTRAAGDHGSSALAGAGVGAAAGAGVGALWALGIAAGLLPGIGPAIAGGILASVLASAAGAAAVGGLVGALVGLGIPEDEAKYYEGEFKAGRSIVTVHSATRVVEAEQILRRFGGYDIRSRDAVAAGGRTIEVKEERLHAHKQPVQTGEVSVRKEVHTEHKTITVPVEREEVVIERRPVGGKATSADIRTGEEIRIPVKEDKVRVEKEAVVTEEVSVGKRKVQDTQTVSGTVRKEEVKVEQKGEVDVRSKTSPKTK